MSYPSNVPGFSGEDPTKGEGLGRSKPELDGALRCLFDLEDEGDVDGRGLGGLAKANRSENRGYAIKKTGVSRWRFRCLDFGHCTIWSYPN